MRLWERDACGKAWATRATLHVRAACGSAGSTAVQHGSALPSNTFAIMRWARQGGPASTATSCSLTALFSTHNIHCLVRATEGVAMLRIPAFVP